MSHTQSASSAVWLAELIGGKGGVVQAESYVNFSGGVCTPVVSINALGSAATAADLATVFRIAGGAAFKGATTVMQSSIDDEVSVSSDSTTHDDVGTSAYAGHDTPLAKALTDICAVVNTRRAVRKVSFEDGYCYLRVIKDEYHQTAISEYGNAFTYSDIKGVPAHWFKNVFELDSVGVALDASGECLHFEAGVRDGAISAGDLIAVGMRQHHTDDGLLNVLENVRIGLTDKTEGSFSRRLDAALASVPVEACWASAVGLTDVEKEGVHTFADVARLVGRGKVKNKRLRVTVSDDKVAHLFDTGQHAYGGDAVQADQSSLFELLENGTAGAGLCKGDCLFSLRSRARAEAVSGCMKDIDEIRRAPGYLQLPVSYRKACSDAFKAARGWLVDTAILLDMRCVSIAKDAFSSEVSAKQRERSLCTLRVMAEGGRDAHVDGWAAAEVEFSQVAVTTKIGDTNDELLGDGLPPCMMKGIAGKDHADVPARDEALAVSRHSSSVSDAERTVSAIMSVFESSLRLNSEVGTSGELVDKLHELQKSPNTFTRGVREQRLVLQIAAQKAGTKVPPDLSCSVCMRLDEAHARVMYVMNSAKEASPSKVAGAEVAACQRALSSLNRERKQLGELPGV